MNIGEAFPSNFLKAADLKGRAVTVIVDAINYEKVGNDQKPIMYFKGKDKGMVLNKTNANAIAYVYGEETDNWIGQPVELFSMMVDFQGRPVQAIRVRVPTQRAPAPRNPVMPNARAQQAPHPNAPGNGAPNVEPPFDDDIPF